MLITQLFNGLAEMGAHMRQVISEALIDQELYRRMVLTESEFKLCISLDEFKSGLSSYNKRNLYLLITFTLTLA